MHLSAPVYRLKRKARLTARATGLPLHEALNRTAVEEGFQSWSHLVASRSNQSPAPRILASLEPGDMFLLAARPGHGKTALGIELAALARRSGRQSVFFTLDYTRQDVTSHLESQRGAGLESADDITIDTSDDICAQYITKRLENKALAVVDYLQLLDQKRTNPCLQDQVSALRHFAMTRDAIIVSISQVNRSFDASTKAFPDLSDVRLPNPVDLSLFNKACFLHDGRIRLDVAT